MTLAVFKWAGTIALIIGFTLFAGGYDTGFWIQISGGISWLTASVMMRDLPLIMTNSLLTLGGLLGRFVL